MTHQELLRFFYSKYSNIISDMRKSDHAYSNDKLNTYHLEGTVWEHTLLVFQESVRRGYGFESDLLALLHDFGKSYTRISNDEKQKVSFYNHESLSIFLSLQIMEDLKLPFDVRERLVKVIGLHTEVFKQPLQALYDLIGDADTYRKLTQLANCDHSGRFCDNINVVDYTYFSPTEKEVKVSEPKNRTVTLLVGLPYSAKSTYVDNLIKHDDSYYVISRDSIIESMVDGLNYAEKWERVDQREVDKILQKMFNISKTKDKVIVDMTHMSKKSRRKTLSNYNNSWFKECITMLPTLKTIEERKANRINKIISEKVMQSMIYNFTPPLPGEGFDRITYKFE